MCLVNCAERLVWNELLLLGNFYCACPSYDLAP